MRRSEWELDYCCGGGGGECGRECGRRGAWLRRERERDRDEEEGFGVVVVGREYVSYMAAIDGDAALASVVPIIPVATSKSASWSSYSV